MDSSEELSHPDENKKDVQREDVEDGWKKMEDKKGENHIITQDGKKELNEASSNPTSISMSPNLRVTNFPSERPILKKCLDEDDETPSWYSHRRHVFVFTNSGKPVFSRYGSEEKLAAFTGMLSAIMAKCTRMFENVSDIGGDDALEHFTAGHRTFTFLQRGSLCLVCVGSQRDDSHYLRRLLERVYLQIVSILTRGIDKTLHSRPGYDLRPLLEGTQNVLSNVISWFARDPFSVVDGFETLPIRASHRYVIASILNDIHRSGETSSSTISAILLAGHRIVAMTKSKIMPRIEPSDMICLVNLIMSSASLRQAESWTPICLPTFHSGAFIYAYINFLSPDVGLIMLSSSSDSTLFHQLSSFYKKCFALLSNTGCLAAIEEAVRDAPLRLDTHCIRNKVRSHLPDDAIIHACLAIPSAAPRPHMNRSGRTPHYEELDGLSQRYLPGQFFSSAFSPSYSTDIEKVKRVIRMYHKASDLLVDAEVPCQLVLESKYEAIYITKTPDYQLYAAFASWMDVAPVVVDALTEYLYSAQSQLFIAEPSMPPL